MSYLYGIRFVGEISPIILALRQVRELSSATLIRKEIYTQPYDTIRFSQNRNNVHPLDMYCPHHPMLNVLNRVLSVYEKLPWLPVLSSYVPLRRIAMERAYQMVAYEDENTGYQTVGPVSKAFNIVCVYAHDGPESVAFKAHMSRVDDFLWLGESGLMMTGTNGTQVWDLVFLAQAMLETGLAEEEENRECVLGILDWLDKAQIKDDPKWYKEGYRHRSKGAWAFSTPEQSYTVSFGAR